MRKDEAKERAENVLSNKRWVNHNLYNKHPKITN